MDALETGGVSEVCDLERLHDLVANVAHELRAPLVPIKGWATSLLQLEPHLGPEKRREALESIVRQAERLDQLIASMLDVSQIEHGLRIAAVGDTDVDTVVRRVVGDFEVTAPDRSFRVRGQRSTRVRANEQRLEQILINLVSNAVKYSDHGEDVEIRVTPHADRVAITIVDRGCGIAPSDIERVFERFHRLHEATTQSGSGLGLYIARKLAEDMGGTITVTSAPGEGSAFTLDLAAAPRRVLEGAD